jgi:hypothetical protein
MSEWGNPIGVMSYDTFLNKIGLAEVSRGTETSYYPEEEKVNNDSASSGERTWKSPNLIHFHLLIQVDKLVDENV